jgi:cbb3-type cytochrome oxidase maturation protein
MEVLYLLIPLSVVAVLALVAVLWWAVAAGQFDDFEGPAHQILMDDDTPQQPEQSPQRPKDI